MGMFVCVCVCVCGIHIVKCEPKAMLVGCNAGITAVDIDLDVSAYVFAPLMNVIGSGI